MSSFELTLPPAPITRNAKTGRYMKGHVPANKGKTWNQYMSKRSQKRAAKGWANLEKYRCTVHSKDAGRARRAVIAVDDDGKMYYFDSITTAATVLNAKSANIRRCCLLNHAGKSPLRGKPNTDHKYNSIRFYFECNNIFLDKIK